MTTTAKNPSIESASYELDRPVWGAEAIGEVLGLTPSQTFHALESGHIKGAKKFGRKWVSTPRLLRQNIGA